MYGDSEGFQPRFVPVKVGDEIEVTIEAVGAKGDGVAKKDGFVLFVPGVQEGDNVRIRVTRVLRSVREESRSIFYDLKSVNLQHFA